MLRRDRQIRTQIYQFVDGGLFALGLWLGWAIRYNWNSIPLLRLYDNSPIRDFGLDYFWLFLVVIPMTPLILEWQGYYEASVFSPRRQVFWQLAKACLISAVFLILIVIYATPAGGARRLHALWICSFALMLLKGEMLRWIYRSNIAQERLRRNVILIGTPEETKELRKTAGSAQQELAIVGEFDLNQSPVEVLVSAIHEHSINTVIIRRQPHGAGHDRKGHSGL